MSADEPGARTAVLLASGTIEAVALVDAVLGVPMASAILAPGVGGVGLTLPVDTGVLRWTLAAVCLAVPGIGGMLARTLFGGVTVSAGTLVRAFVAHYLVVACLALAGLVAVLRTAWRGTVMDVGPR